LRSFWLVFKHRATAQPRNISVGAGKGQLCVQVRSVFRGMVPIHCSQNRYRPRTAHPSHQGKQAQSVHLNQNNYLTRLLSEIRPNFSFSITHVRNAQRTVTSLSTILCTVESLLMSAGMAVSGCRSWWIKKSNWDYPVQQIQSSRGAGERERERERENPKR
jgi:hypothetical protein